MTKERKNVILITVDSLRPDFTGLYKGQNGDLTPNLDDFGTESVLFENAVAQGSYTRASIPSFFSSIYPWKLEKGGDISNRETLATVLNNNGYNTAFFHSNPFLSRAMGCGRGFDVFDDSLLPWNLKLSQKRVRQMGRLFRLLRRTPYLPANKLAGKSLRWLEKADTPYFLWVHFMDPHGPYQSTGGGYLAKYRAERLWNKAVNSPEEITSSEKERLIDAYRDEVGFTDDNIDLLLDHVEEKGKENVICITADHGEEFGEHGDYSHNPKPFEELIHVPLMFKVDGSESRRISEPVELLDIFPTVLDLVGIDAKKYDLDGRSLMGLIEGDSGKAREYVVSQPGQDEICIRSNRWKLVLRGSEELLFDLKNDPGEAEDISDVRKGVVDRLKKELAEREEELGSSPEFSEVLQGNETEETRQRLEDLGYL